MAGLAPTNPEASIQTSNPVARNSVLPPILAVANAATALDVYNELNDPIAPKAKYLTLQNLSTTALKYALNTACSDVVFSGVLQACTGQDDGKGGSKDLLIAENGIQQVSVLCQGAAVRCVVQIYLKS